MEIMTKEEYVVSKMQMLINAYIELDEGIHRLIGDDRYSKDNTAIDICSALDIAVDSDEASALIERHEVDEAYDAYVEANKEEPLHDYAVSFSIPGICGTVHVKAESEDDAEEYVVGNITHNICSDDFEMIDDENVIGDIELDGDRYGFDDFNVDDVEDYGEYEED